MLARDAYFLIARFPLAAACLEMVLMLAIIGLIGYALLPIIGY
jgi:hypothetical protein